MQHVRSTLRIGWLVSTLACMANAGVLIVAPSGGDFTTIQAALDASSDGDVILVKSGTYPGFVIDNRDVEVVEDHSQTVTISGPVRVLNVGAGKAVLLDGLDVSVPHTFPVATLPALRTDDCVGSIRVQDCSFVCDLPTAAAIRVCADVALVDSVFRGRDELGSYMGRALDVTSSNVAAYEVRTRGASPGQVGDSYGDGFDGAVAVQLQASYVFLSNGTAQGGTGDDCQLGPGIWCSSCFPPGTGGDALRAGGASVVEFVNFACIPGPGGSCLCGSPTYCCADAGPGQALVRTEGSTAIDWPHSARVMSLASPLREKTNTSVKFRGQPGDFVRLAVTAGTQFAFDPASIGVQIFQPPALGTHLRPIGTIGANGVLTHTLALPDLGPGVASHTHYMQAIFRDVNGQQHLGTPRAVLVLDSAY